MGTPWEREARFNLAVLYHLAGDVKEAEGRYRPLVEADPPHEGAAANLLGLLLMQGRRDEGVALAERLFPPGRPVAAAALPELAGNAAALLLDAGKADAAAPLLAPGAFRGTAPPSAAWNRAVLAWKLGDGAGARSASAAVTPATAALWAVKASRPEWDRADLDRRIDGLEPPPRDDRRLLASSRILSAWEAWRKGDGDGAERLLRQASPDRPDEADAGLGLLLAEKGRWKEARTILEALTKRRPALPEGWLNLGIYRELYEGNGAGALECYRRYVNLGGSRKDEVGKWIEWLERSPSR
jgi:Flp pilus assembly protein TadD